ncbi:MAG: hypothetical protein QM520_00325 [Gammaproteobacteria bacterium]|nr:hypothetical protein [Gammaproteobacteria bacterium]
METIYKFDSGSIDPLATGDPSSDDFCIDENRDTPDSYLPEMAGDLAILDGSPDSHSPYRGDQEFVYAPSYPISKNSYQKITAKDYPAGPQRMAFILLQKAIHGLLIPNINSDSLDLAYCFQKFESHQPTFLVCCKVLAMRPDILRLRIQFEWWRRQSHFDAEVKFSFCPVPQFVWQHKIFAYHLPAIAIVRETWRQPGLTIPDLWEKIEQLDGYDASSLETSLQLLKNDGIISVHQQSLYMTGRNGLAHETLMKSVRKRNMSWLDWFEADN